MSKKTVVSIHTDKEMLKRQGFSEHPAAHEDCMRTSGQENTYEWWYADAVLEDGSTAVAVFYTKLLPDYDKPLSPTVQVTYTAPGGKPYDFYCVFDAEEAHYATTGACDVRIGKNYFRGGLANMRSTWRSKRITSVLISPSPALRKSGGPAGTA